VPPHGHRELAHPEHGFYTVGIKSYGRAPTFLLLTGYEQVRSVAAVIVGDMEAADNVRLVLRETGVCSTRPGCFHWLVWRPRTQKNHRVLHRRCNGKERRKGRLRMSHGGVSGSAGETVLNAKTPSRAIIIPALGATQIFAWGTSYYLPAVLAAPIAADTGWSLA
jgi:hypothetical protein